MRYIIDGYNLLFFAEESKGSLQSRRQTIIRSLQIEFAQLKLKGTIVFDGSYQPGEQSGLSYKSPLVIAYSHQGQTADQYILETLEGAKAPGEITIVTNDRGLSMQARNFGAKSMTIQSFLAYIKKKHTQKEDVEEKKSMPLSQRELDRLLKLFEKRLEE